MPTYRSISLALHSQHDIQTLPEFYPASQDHDVPPLIDESSSTCNVHVPVLPGSNFWISYSVAPPVPDSHYFLFKLYINGAHVVNWSTGQEEGWRGKTMFALYERAADEEGKKRVEKRVLCFAQPEKSDKTWRDVNDLLDKKMCLEVKVHRAHGRKRMERELGEFDKTQRSKGINLVNAGTASSDHPKRFYKFALIDPIDQPFATFRYYYRTWDQLRGLGLLETGWQGALEDNELSVIEPDQESLQQRDQEDGSSVSQEDYYEDYQDPTIGLAITSDDGDDPNSLPPDSASTLNSYTWSPLETGMPSRLTGGEDESSTGQPRSYVPRGAPSTVNEHAQRHSGTRTPPELYRFSTPLPIENDRYETALEHLNQFQADTSTTTAYHPHPVVTGEEARAQARSPIHTSTGSVSASAPEKKDCQGSWVHAVSSMWTRRNVSGGERCDDVKFKGVN